MEDQESLARALKDVIVKEINTKRLYDLSSFDYCLDDAFNRSVKIYEQTLKHKI